MNRLDGKVALISGGARGIGAEIAGLMARAGAKVIIGDILEDAGQACAESIVQAGGKAQFLSLDVSRESDWSVAADTAVSDHGGLDVLVNNAAIFLGRSIDDVSLQEWHKLVAVNLTGVFLGTKLCAPALRDSGSRSAHGSAIVNMSSIAGLVGAALDPLYSMTKGGVTLFTKSTALAFAGKGERVRVNCIHPGVIDTEMGDQTIVTRASLFKNNDIEASRADTVKRHPVGRMGTTDDIAKGALFLASDDSAFMTGSSLVIDGGLTAQ